jgi:ATP-dependent Clp protease ATP-binding subunit ClpA
MGIGDEELEMVQEQMDSVMESLDENETLGDLLRGAALPPEMLGDQGDDDSDEEDDENSTDPDIGFQPGGARAFPNFFRSIMPSAQNPDGAIPQAPGSTPPPQNQRKKDAKKPNDKPPKNRKHITLYCEDITKKARNGEIDRIIGRDKEIERVIQILSRRTKNNPCLIGEPGVGKTAIAEGLAIKIARQEVPQRLKNKEVQMLDLTSLIAGTQFRGQFESRIKGLIKEIKDAGNIILFIDEVHQLVGAGDNEGTMNAANILKPALSRGEIQVIGATTFNEYRKHIEKDSALERRFQPVTVGEPSVAETIEVLGGVKDYYEQHHNVIVDSEIVRKVVIFSERYINDRFLPDKAIDLLDEACSCASIANKDREKYDSLVSKKAQLEAVQNEYATSGEELDYEALAKVTTEIALLDEELNNVDKKNITAAVTEADLAKVIELWTGIPSSKVQENELLKLKDIGTTLKQHIIGQDEAVDALSSAIKRSRVQISPRRRPASFIFVGPTGVGKTELVKVLAKELFDTPETLIRLDMSEFMEKHSVSKIIGSPPGYVGYDEAGQVTEKVRRKPYSVLLFDEIEKAHPDVLNILLQIMDEGRLTDAHGRVVNFEHTVIVMTSNAGSDKRENSLGFGKSSGDITREKALKALSDFLRPEFLARIDEVIVFKELTLDNYKNIAKLMLSEYIEVLAEKSISFTFDDEVCAYIAEESIGGKSGARDLRNFIRRQAEDKIAETIINNPQKTAMDIKLVKGENGVEVLVS